MGLDSASALLPFLAGVIITLLAGGGANSFGFLPYVSFDKNVRKRKVAYENLVGEYRVYRKNHVYPDSITMTDLVIERSVLSGYRVRFITKHTTEGFSVGRLVVGEYIATAQFDGRSGEPWTITFYARGNGVYDAVKPGIISGVNINGEPRSAVVLISKKELAAKKDLSEEVIMSLLDDDVISLPASKARTLAEHTLQEFQIL